MYDPASLGLAGQMVEKSDEELLAMLAAAEDWTPAALDAARAELDRRGVSAEPSTEALPTGPEDAAADGAAAEAAEVPPVIGATPSYGGPAVPAGVRCVQHPHIHASCQCRRCGAFMCPTCDFSFPGGIHFCPACVSRSEGALGPRRKKMLIAAYALAGWSTVGMACVVSGALRGTAPTKADQLVLGWVLILFVLAPAATGLALALTARRRTGANPATITLALVWNAILTAIFFLRMVAGLARH